MIFREPAMGGCGEETSLEKPETPQTHPKPQSPLRNFLNFSTIHSTMPNIQSSKIALEELCVSVQSRMIPGCCAKPAAFAFQLSLFAAAGPWAVSSPLRAGARGKRGETAAACG